MSVQAYEAVQLRSIIVGWGDLNSCCSLIPDLLYTIHRPLFWPQPPCYTMRGMEEMLSEAPSASDRLQFLIYWDPGSLVRILGRIWAEATVFSFLICLNFYFKNENNIPENLHLKFKSEWLHSSWCHFGSFYSVFFIREQSTQFYLEPHGVKSLGWKKHFPCFFHLAQALEDSEASVSLP